MPLTTRSNGSSSPNVITSDWFNDFLKLFTGVMTDQEVTFNNNLALKALGVAPAALSAALGAGTALQIGAYLWKYTFVSPDGESLPSPSASLTTTSGNQNPALSSIAVGPTGTTARNIYRTQVGGSTYTFVKAIADNTTTTTTDTATDASIVGNAPPPANPTFGGSLVIKDSTGTVKGLIRSDGSVSFDGGLIHSDGAGNLTTAGGASTINNNNTFTQWKDSGGTARNIIGVDSSNNTQLLAPASGTKILLKDNGGLTQLLINNATPQVEVANDLKVDGALTVAGTSNLHTTNFTLGSITRMALAGPYTTSDTSTAYNHNLGVVPSVCIPIISGQGTSNIHQIYIDFPNATSSQVNMRNDTGAALTVYILSIKF